MSSTLTQVGSFFGSSGGKEAVGGATAGAGFLQNWMAQRQASQKQKFVQDLIQNPAKFAAYVSSFQKPLAAGLTSDISRQTDAYGAERGLGSSPAVMKDTYAQALAPFLLQQQNSAEQTALQSLGIYENSPTQKPMDVSGILKALMGGGGGTNPTAGIDLSSAPPNTFNPPPGLPSPLVSGDTSGIGGDI